jgi:hypothetical protein
VQAAAAARVAGGPDIFDSARNGDGVSVICNLIDYADGFKDRDTGRYLPASLCPSFIFIIFMQQNDSFAFLQSNYSTA